MTREQVNDLLSSQISEDKITLPSGATVTIDDFLIVAGFKDCDPTKDAMLNFDGEVKGYADLFNLIKLSE